MNDISYFLVFNLKLVVFHQMNVHGPQMGHKAQLRKYWQSEVDIPSSGKTIPSGAFVNKVFTIT